MKNSIKHIVIAGSSGGHILPAIKYLNELSHHCSSGQIMFITNEVGADYLHLIEYEKKNVTQINSQNKMTFILKIIKEIWKILIFNKKITLLGFGGFISVPVLFFAKITNILFLKGHKINFHEQNYVYGLANKFNYFIAHRVFTSFPNNYLKSKEIFVGNFFANLEKKFEKLDNKFINILLIGGSAGSLELNKFLSKELLKIDRTLIKNFKFYIQAPKRFLEEISKEYKNLKFFINVLSIFKSSLDRNLLSSKEPALPPINKILINLLSNFLYFFSKLVKKLPTKISFDFK